MVETLRRASPAIDDITRPGLSLRHEPMLGIAKIRIREPGADARFAAIIGTAPPASRTQIDRDGFTVAWLAPGEWLVTGDEANVAALLGRETLSAADDVLTVDLSHARAAFLLTGDDARTALAAHCPLDLWPTLFPIDAVARSLLGEVTLFIARLDDSGTSPRYRLIIDQTMAGYVSRLFGRQGDSR